MDHPLRNWQGYRIPKNNVTEPPLLTLSSFELKTCAVKPFTIPSLPYSNFINRFPSATPGLGSDILEDLLGSSFLDLLDGAISTIRQDPDHPSGSPSYNVLLTLEHLYLIPRRREKYVFKESQQEDMSVNALGFAGMLLVKSEEDLEGVKREGALNVLAGVAVPPYEIVDSTPHD
jgi:ATP adenylyltransferase